MIVIYAEKPDMGEKIAKSLGGRSFHPSEKKNGYYNIQYDGQDYAVTWGYGHLCTLADASGYDESYKNWKNIPIPFFPDDYKIVLNTESKSPVKATYKIVKQLFNQSDYIINATDFDREGELIFWYLYSYMKCRKPIMRAKLSSTTDLGIHEAFDNLMNASELAGLLSSAQCRSIADWAVGINLTVAMTLRSNSRNICSIGRVQTPTLAMIVKRDEEIKNFKPEDYYTVEAVFGKIDTGETYKGLYEKKRFDKKEDVEAVADKCRNYPGIVESIDESESTKSVPHLYNLDALQMEANGKYGMSLKMILDIVQRLYEKGFVTYPRTDCQFLPEDMFDKILQIQDMLRSNGYGGKFNEYADADNMRKHKKLFFDDSRVDSHYAIIPTENAPESLDAQEQKIYDMIADSVIRMLYPDARIGKTKVVTTVNHEKFITNGSHVIFPGWMSVGNEKTDEEMIPDLSIGEKVSADASVQSKQTKPPKHYTDKTILGAMVSAGKNLEDEDLKAFMLTRDNPGIGTVATRAGIIETLISRGYIVREKKNILATSAGTALIHAVPVEQVKSAEMTAVYEKRLNDIVDGNDSPDQFLTDIYTDIAQWCKDIKEIPMENMPDLNTTNLICPVCGAPLTKFKWGYGCSNYDKGNGCRFSMGAVCGKVLTENQMRTFLAKEEIGPLKFTKKDGTQFDATLVLTPVEEDGEIVNYKAEFKKRPSLMNEMEDVYATCPKCHGTMIKGPWGWVCSNDCGFSVPYSLCGRKFTTNEAEGLIAQKSLPTMDGFISKKGKPFSAALKLKSDYSGIEFVFPPRSDD